MTPLARSHAHALPEEPQAPVPQETALGEHGQHGQHSMRAIALRAGLAALALSVAVSGAAYAAVRAGEPSRTSGVEAAAKGTDGLGAEGGRSRVSVTPSTQKVTTETVDATDPHGSVQQESGDLSEGETKVATAGVDGVVRTTYEVTTVGGKEVSRTPVAQVVVTQKVDEVVLVGTGAAKKQESKPEQSQGQAQSQGQGQTQAPSASSESSGGSGGSASGGSAGTTGGEVGDDVWAQLAQCESGGNPATNTGNGFYGMYQFTLETWQSLGGTGYPYEADAATQTAMAKKLQAQAGWGQWPGCADKLGLR
ncbi:resuscitation-promoting factor [Actinomyces oris]|uniref:Resuscitation-promoting factor n=1 Tax=Actinomyces oris TaxID=544580 RepID=A0A508BGL7_9ACTO|nr:resuscitation-promoting factor [Actinomyces oris]QQC39727.1 resuscitation-promoting factor [Actinomyces oris]TQD61646.1 resuscitation-promoting factor [Actinomyces oris]